MTSSLHLLCEKCDNASYVNCLADAQFGEDDFRNADHLNAQGARRFSRLLNDVIEQKVRPLDSQSRLHTHGAGGNRGTRN